MSDTYTTADVASRLGITIPLLRILAKKIPPDDALREKTRGVLRWTEAGVRALADLIAKPAEAEKEAPGAILALPAPPEYRCEEVVCLRSREQGIINAHIVIVHRIEADPTNPANHLAVRVRDNTNYIRGMKFHARFNPDNLGTAWEPRTDSAAMAPRSRGRL